MADAPVLFVARFVPAYRWPVLERLDDRLGGRLVVCSGDPPGGTAHDAGAGDTAVRRIPLRNTWWAGERIHRQAYRTLFEEVPHPAVVLAEESPRSLSLPGLLRAARHRGAGTLLWGHFMSNDRPFDPGRSPADRYRLTLARMVDGIVCYGSAGAGQMRRHLPADRVFTAVNTLDTDTLDDLRGALEAEGRSAVRTRLGFGTDETVLLFVGRLVADKGVDLLLDTAAELARSRPTRVVVIGDGPLAGHVRTRAHESIGARVTALGGMADPARSAPWFFAADVLLVPGRLGLAVNHAFAFGLPVVSVTPPGPGRYHGPEAEHVVPGRTGMLVPARCETLAAAVDEVMDRREVFSTHALETARRELSVDRMVDGLVEAVRFAEGVRRARLR